LKINGLWFKNCLTFFNFIPQFDTVEYLRVQKTTTDPTAVAASSPKTKEQPQHVSPDGLWRSFPKVPCLMQYVPSAVFFARVRHKGKLFRQSLETDAFTTAKLRLPDKLKVDSIQEGDC
jgi:hypothetical protein